MNRVIHFKQTEDSKVFVTTDTHLKHDRAFVWEIRGFKNSKEHTDAIIDGINENARFTDKLIHFGDFCLNTDESGLNELLSRIQCQNIYLLWGNHNNPLWKIYQREVKEWLGYNDEGYNTLAGGTPHIDDEIEIYPFRYRNLIFVGNYLEFTVDGKFFVGSHYPIAIFNQMQNGTMHLCGHSHYNYEKSKATNLDSKILDVGWDGHNKILTIEEVLAIMEKKGLQVVDHHGKKNV